LLRFLPPLLVVILGVTPGLPEEGAPTIELIRFESAQLLRGRLQQKFACELGKALKPFPGEVIEGYLTKPNGSGPFAAVVHLHECGGLGGVFRAQERQWVLQVVGWGYVVFVVEASRRVVSATPAAHPRNSTSYPRSAMGVRHLRRSGNLI